MSNLLEFQHSILQNKKVIFSIETSDLNPKDIETTEVEESREEFEVNKYDLKTLREYILKHSTKLSETGNIIKGEVKNNKVVLTILKIKE